MDDGTGPVPHDRHESIDPDEHQNAGDAARLQDRRDPTVGAEFDGRGHGHRDQHDPHERRRERDLEHFTHAYTGLDSFRYRERLS